MANLIEILSDPAATWTRRPPVTEDALQALVSACDFSLPEEYLTFLRCSNGGEGRMCLDTDWFRLCSAEDVIGYNLGYGMPTFLPRYFAIGSNGGDELLGIKKSDGSPCPVYLLPFIKDERDIECVAHDFEMFAMALGRG